MWLIFKAWEMHMIDSWVSANLVGKYLNYSDVIC